MHVHQPAAREDAQPDQEDVLDPEAREPALPGGGGGSGMAREGGAMFRGRHPRASRQPCPASRAAPTQEHCGVSSGPLRTHSTHAGGVGDRGPGFEIHRRAKSIAKWGRPGWSALYRADRRHFLRITLRSSPHLRTRNRRTRPATHTALCGGGRCWARGRAGRKDGPGSPPGQRAEGRGQGVPAVGTRPHTRGPGSLFPMAKAGTQPGAVDTGGHTPRPLRAVGGHPALKRQGTLASAAMGGGPQGRRCRVE